MPFQRACIGQDPHPRDLAVFGPKADHELATRRASHLGRLGRRGCSTLIIEIMKSDPPLLVPC